MRNGAGGEREGGGREEGSGLWGEGRGSQENKGKVTCNKDDVLRL